MPSQQPIDTNLPLPKQLGFDARPFPRVISASGDLDYDQWICDNRDQLTTWLDESGVILFRGLPITSVSEFDQFSAVFDYPDFTYQESLSNAVRVNLSPRVFTANEAPPEVEIFLHHEMAQTPLPPRRIFFTASVRPNSAGRRRSAVRTSYTKSSSNCIPNILLVLNDTV